MASACLAAAAARRLHARARIQARRGHQRVRQDRAGRGRSSSSARRSICSSRPGFRSTNVEIDVDKSAPAIERALGGDPAGHHALRERSAAGRIARVGAIVAAVRSFVRDATSRPRATSPSRSSPTRTSSSTRATWTPGSPIRSARRTRCSRFARPPVRSSARSQGRAALPAGQRRRAERWSSRAWLGNRRAQPDLAPRRRRLRRARHRAHPDRLRSSAVPALPGRFRCAAGGRSCR